MSTVAKLFIDGQEGTTGLAIHEHLVSRGDVELLEIDQAYRKDDEARRELFQEADLAVLCLPDEAAKTTLELAGDTKLIDASTAHRVNPSWVYGLPELCTEQRDAIARARRVSNPGCYPTGFLLLIRPLIDAGVLSRDQLIKVNAVSGYSGGGKKLISKYEPTPSEMYDTRPYGLGLRHKHLPEMQKYALLNQTPLFTPSVGPFRQGMLVQIPLGVHELETDSNGQDIAEIYSERYRDEQYVLSHEFNDESMLEENFLSATARVGTNFVDLFVFGNEEQLLLVARLDNLGKGASLAAVQNINLMLGIDESTDIPTKP